MNIYLRKATIEDLDLIYTWANDSTTRQNSFNTEPIPYENHVKWYKGIMADDTVLLYIMCDNVTTLGQIRLNLNDTTATISYSIAPDQRGKGYGEKIITLLEDEIKRNNPTIKTLIAQVKYDNIASSRIFEKCGFKRFDREDCIEYRL